MLGRDFAPTLLQYIDASQLPVALGALLLGLLAHAALPVACRNTKLRKAESMVHYWDARVPFWNGKGSHADIKGQETRAFIADLEAKARKRYDALY